MPRKVIAWVATGIALFTISLVVLLWWWGTAGLSGKELVTARLDALRTGLSIGIGGGGVFALYLAWRRQHATEVGLVQKELDQADVARAYELQVKIAEQNRAHAERVAASTEKDAADRRVTDLYTKASEQLGSDKAPVRLAGIYALERLAQDNPEQRQTIVNLICAYLRMPYLPPGDQADPDHRERVQELEVRRTAQQVLASHLRPKAAAMFWGEALELNLNRATLVAWDLRECRLGKVDFREAVFVGVTDFDGAVFTDRASFQRVVFEHFVRFADAEFETSCWFFGAVFHGVEFWGANFKGAVAFDDAKFHAPVEGFAETGDWSVGDVASFDSVTFRRLGQFYGASFDGGVDFIELTGGRLDFGGAVFQGVSHFRGSTGTTFSLTGGHSGRDSARVSTGDAATRSTWPENWVVGDDGVITERPVETSASD